MSSYDEDEFLLLGGALTAAQRVEFVLYGLAAHASHLPQARKDKRFRDLTPEKFLRGSADELKATLGQLVEVFGDPFMIKTPDLVGFYKDRNLIAHDYFKVFKTKIKNSPLREDGKIFLLDFIDRATKWEHILRGLLTELQISAAKREGRESELSLTEQDLERQKAFFENAETFLRFSKMSSRGGVD